MVACYTAYHVFAFLFGWLFDLEFPTVNAILVRAKTLLSMLPRVVVGNLTDCEFTSVSEYTLELKRVTKQLEKQTKSPFVYLEREVPFILTKCYDAIARLELIERRNIIRPQPFGILVSGPPGTGKSFGTLTLCKQLYNLNHQELQSDQIVVLNEGDEFQSEFRTQHKVVIFDDLGATRVNVVSHDPFRKIIDFINNIPKTALNPHLELKGNVWIEPDIVAVTTNLPIPFTGNTQQNTNAVFCPEALNRRFPLMIYQFGYDQFKVLQPRYKPAHGWNYHDNYNHIPTWNRQEVLSYARDEYLNHCRAQKAFVEMVNGELKDTKTTTPNNVENGKSSFISGMLTKAKNYFSKQITTGHIKDDDTVPICSTVSIASSYGILSNSEMLKAESLQTNFTVLIAMQHYLRLLSGKIAFNNPIAGAILVLCKRFAASPLQILKNRLRSIYISSLYKQGISNVEVGPRIIKTEKFSRRFTTILSILSSRNESDFLATILSVILYGMLKSISSTYFYDILYLVIPSCMGELYRRMLVSSETAWPLRSEAYKFIHLIINKYPYLTHCHNQGQNMLESSSSIVAPYVRYIQESIHKGQVYATIYGRQLVTAIVGTKLNTEGRTEYFNRVVDVHFIEACLERLNIKPKDDFGLTIFRDGVVVHFQNTTHFYSQYIREQPITPCQGIWMTREEFLAIRARFYNTNLIKPEGKFSIKHKGTGKTESIDDEEISSQTSSNTPKLGQSTSKDVIFEVKYKRNKKNLNFYPRQFRTEDSTSIVQEFKEGRCSIVKCLNAMGGLENAQLCFVPNFHLTENNEFVRGRISLVYFKHRKRMYIILREKHDKISFYVENIVSFFGDSCPIHAIACPSKGTNRYILPILDEDPYPLRDDLAVMHLHLDVQHVLYGSAFAKGSLFRYKALKHDVLYKSICVKDLELLSSQVEESSGSLKDGESYEIATPKDHDNTTESQET